jgi:TPR repeat protein
MAYTGGIQSGCRGSPMKRLLFALLFAAVMAGPASAEKRVALVVGNSAYRSVTRLDNPSNDATMMALTLKELGFALVGGGARTDLDKRGLDEAVQALGRELRGADVAVFYYAGHGVQLRGANYLVPVDANPTREADVDFQMVDVAVVLNQMQGSGTRLNMLILDACRNNPFGARGLRASAGGLAQLRAPDGTLISYATQPGNVAQDGEDGHSPYTRALAATLRRPGLDLFGAFNEVGLAVKRATGGAQQPWVSSSPIDGSFFFAGAPSAVPDGGTVTRRDDGPPVPARQEARLSDPAAPQPGDVVTECDRQAANPADPLRPKEIGGVRLGEIQIVPALAACRQAMREYPGVARFVYQAGRVAQLQNDFAVAKELYEKAADMHYAASYVNLGVLSQQGNGAPKDYDAARGWYEKAVAAGDPAGLHAIGGLYEQGAGVPRDYGEACRWYEKAFTKGGGAPGRPPPHASLGWLYMNGNGVTKDPARARALLEPAAALGEPIAMRLLGVVYDRGIGVAPDPDQARRWFEKAAAGGDGWGMNDLGWLFEQGRGAPKDYAQARQWYEKARALGIKFATVNLGRMYEDGIGVPADPARAKSLFESVADTEPVAMRKIGFMYDRGIGVPKDYGAARGWYEKAVPLGDSFAMNNLGYIYDAGNGVPNDLGRARDLYVQAAALGHVLAMVNLGNLYRDGRGVPKDYGQARQWYEKAAAGGQTFAMVQIGDFCRRGLGVPKDPAQARQWYEKAAAAGDPRASKALTGMSRR